MNGAAVGAGSVLSGRYRLVEPLASGGMGTVWRALDLLLDRPVAVKEVRPPPGLDDKAREAMRRRTIREAQAAARLRHPAVVTIYDVVEQDGRPWIVMELVPSRSLAEIIRADGPLPPGRVAAIGLRVLDAMVAAAAVGVEHRDIKPANVLVTNEGRVVLTDFGIARHVGDETLTSAGLIVGSPDYLAPERARGRSGGLAADLWSLGATLYDAVEGRRPFEREGALPTLAAVVMDEPDPPQRAGPLRPVIDGLLVKDPAHRLDADRTRAMLSRVLRGRPPGGTVPLPRRPLDDAPAMPPAPMPVGPPSMVDQQTAVDQIAADQRTAADQTAADQRTAAHQTAADQPTTTDRTAVDQQAAADQTAADQRGTTDQQAAAEPTAADTPRSGENQIAVAAQTAVESPPAAERQAGSEDARARTTDYDAPGTTTTGEGPRPPSRGDATAPPGRPRRRRWIALLVGLLVLAGVAAVLVPLLNSGGQEQANGPATPAAGPTASAAGGRSTGTASSPAAGSGRTTGRPTTAAPTRTAAPNPTPNPRTNPTSAAGTLLAAPAGFTRYTDSRDGFSVVVPSGWRPVRLDTRVDFDDPSSSRFLRIDTSDHPLPDPYQNWIDYERQFRQGKADYQLIGIRRVSDYRPDEGWTTADWEFTLGGTHVLDRNIRVSDVRAHAIYWSTPESRWNAADSRQILRLAEQSFVPAPAG